MGKGRKTGLDDDYILEVFGSMATRATLCDSYVVEALD